MPSLVGEWLHPLSHPTAKNYKLPQHFNPSMMTAYTKLLKYEYDYHFHDVMTRMQQGLGILTW